MEFHALLHVENVGGHPVNLHHDGVQIEFLPPNTTSLLQPMDQGVFCGDSDDFTTMKKQRSKLPITMFLTKVKKNNQATSEENTPPPELSEEEEFPELLLGSS